MARDRMIRCQHCRAETQNYLCNSCTNTLANMLEQLPWLITELDNRTHKQTRIGTTTNGRTNRPQELTPIDFDAANLSQQTRATLLHWVTTIAQRHTGRQPAALATAHTKHLAAWLYTNLNAITLLNCAGQLYTDIEKLVGPDTERLGHLVAAINATERHFAGPCPTLTGHDQHGEPIQCETPLYADTDQPNITCPTCKQRINVEQNRLKAAVDRDLLPERKLLEVLNNLGEHISRVKLYQWIREQRILPKGWLNKDHGILSRDDVRRRGGDPAVYSLRRARKLRIREQQRQERQMADGV